VEGENDVLLAHSHSILNRWKNYFYQLLNVLGINDVKQTEIHTPEPLAPESSSSEVKITTESLKRCKTPGTDQVLPELIQAGDNILCSEIDELINSVQNKKKLPQQWKESILVPIYEEGNKTKCNNYRGISLLPTTYKILSLILPSRLTP
jgi:hypothetical protein